MLDIATNTNTNTIITTPCCFSLISRYCAHFVQETGTSISNCWFWSTLLRNTSVLVALYTFLTVKLTSKQVKLHQILLKYWQFDRNIVVYIRPLSLIRLRVDWVRKVMAHAQKTHFLFRRKGRVHLNRRGRQFIRFLAAEVCA
jgi:hypothetical protein